MKKLGVTNIMKIARKNYFSTSKCPGRLCLIYLITQTNINNTTTSYHYYA